SFDNKGGTQDFHVYSDGKSYSVSNTSDWCSVEQKNGFFTVTCKQNYGAYRNATLTVTTDSKTASVLIEQTEAVATYIRSNPNSVKVSALGGKTEISIQTDGYEWSHSDIPFWITVSKSGKTLTLTARSNSGNVRNGNIIISSGNYSASINISQPQQASYIKAGKSSIRFSTGGSSETISVETDGENWTYTNVPSWIRAIKDGNRLTLKCDENTGQYSGKRETSFTIQSDNKTANVYVSQSAPFNAPKGDPHPLGLSFGYVQKQWTRTNAEGTTKYGTFDDGKNYLDGIQAGVRFEPLFKYGFGLNTGLFYEHYFAKSGEYAGTDGDYNYTMNFTEHSLYLPLHLEYRANISENFQVFAYGGVGLDYGLSAKLTATETDGDVPFYTKTDIYRNAEMDFPNKPFNASLDFGAGIRFNGLQLNVGMSRGLMNISSDRDIKIKQNKPLAISLSWMIPQEDTPINSPGEDSYDQFAPIKSHGITAGFISKQWEYTNETYTGEYGLWGEGKTVSGFRLGYVYQPNFAYGFGLRTGLNLDTYISVSDDMYDDYDSYYMLFREMAVNIPLHAVYRLHFVKNFSIFVETGVSADIGIFAETEVKSNDYDPYTESNLYGKSDWGYPSERFNMYFDILGGFRIRNCQISAGTSCGLTPATFTDGDGYEWKARQNRNFQIELSWFF
ncbi:MAG: outer membrane beta-barrel protein, partial [Prevotellaceae bacterium]|nr:outer membrane beta-barrel protein [Prevotellaceae bacterium]